MKRSLKKKYNAKQSFIVQQKIIVRGISTLFNLNSVKILPKTSEIDDEATLRTE